MGLSFLTCEIKENDSLSGLQDVWLGCGCPRCLERGGLVRDPWDLVGLLWKLQSEVHRLYYLRLLFINDSPRDLFRPRKRAHPNNVIWLKKTRCGSFRGEMYQAHKPRRGVWGRGEQEAPSCRTRGWHPELCGSRAGPGAAGADDSSVAAEGRSRRAGGGAAVPPPKPFLYKAAPGDTS